jgi:hypothetical protein
MAPPGLVDAPQNPGQAIPDEPEPDPVPPQAPAPHTATTQPEPTHDPEVLNPEPEHEVVFAPITSDDEAEPDIDQWPDDHEPVDPEEIEHTNEQKPIDCQEVDEQEPNLEPQPRRRPPHRANREINRRNADFFALTSIIAGTPFATGQTHPTLAHGDGLFKTLDWDEPPRNSTSKALYFLAAVTFDDELRHDTLMSTYPTILAVNANDADLPSFAGAMASDDCDGFCKAMDSEIEELVKKLAWDFVPLLEPERLQKQIFGTLRAFGRKRYPDGTLRKLKARICCHGDQQIVGLDVFGTYAPVVSWSVVRLALTTSVAMGWATAQVDYANVFVQAKLDDPVYITCPRQYEVPGHVLRLNRSLYGLRESPLNWFNTLSEGLQKQGFKQCNHVSEPCLFIKKDVMVVLHLRQKELKYY